MSASYTVSSEQLDDGRFAVSVWKGIEKVEDHIFAFELKDKAIECYNAKCQQYCRIEIPK